MPNPRRDHTLRGGNNSWRLLRLLKDGRKVRGGGHGDAAALYFPPHYTADQIRESLLSALRTAREAERPVGLSLGDLLKEKLNGN